jgi:DNA-binding CsgD family transcriptional regulator/tetratricopeptide (TPR) repeat protein
VDHPVLLLVDDLQWADQPSLRWLAYLAVRIQDLPIQLVVAVREGNLRVEQPLLRQIVGSATSVLCPAPLSRKSTQMIVDRQCEQRGDYSFVTACYESSAGNPLLLLGLLAEVIASGRKPIDAEADAVRTLRPAMLRDRLRSCLRSQDSAARRFLEAMSVLGDQDELDLIGGLVDLDLVACREAHQSLRRQGLVEDERRPRFAHAVIQEAVEESTPPYAREMLHVRAAALLHEHGRPAEQVAAQLLAITSTHDQWATDVLRGAAAIAVRRGAPEMAVRYLRRALLNCPTDGEERARLLVDLATVERAFDSAASIRHISQAVPLLGSPGERAEAVLRIAPIALGTATPHVVELVRRVSAELGHPEALVGADRDRALHLEARIRELETDDPTGLARAVDRLSTADHSLLLSTHAGRELLVVLLHAATLTARMPFAEVSQLAHAVLDREPVTFGHAYTSLRWLVITMTAADSLADLDDWLASGLERAQAQKDTVAHVGIRVEQALVFLAKGRMSQAKACAVDAVALAGPDWDDATTGLSCVLAGVAMETREPELVHLVSHVHRNRSVTPVASSFLQMLRGVEAAGSGRHEIALEHLLDAGRQLDRLDWRNPALFPWRIWAAGLYRRQGHNEAAVALAEQEYKLALAWGAPAALGRALRVRGALDEGEPGLALLRQAVDVLESSSNLLELGKAEVALGRRLLDSNPGVAQEMLRRGHSSAERCGATWLAEQVTHLAGGRGSRLIAATTPLSLTPAESRVAKRAVSGATNQAIADDLGVSRRAVEKHLTSAYRKLDVPGRAGLVEALGGARS